MRTLKFKQGITLAFLLFFCGSLMVYLGFSKGHDIAANLSRPTGASGWITSKEMILACTYTPVIMGASLIVLSLIFSTVLFIRWIK